MIEERVLDRKTKEIVVLIVSLLNRCTYCALADGAMAQAVGASTEEIDEVKQVLELFVSFNVIADSLAVPCDIFPEGD